MRIQNNLKRAFNFIVNHRNEIFTAQFWATVARVYRERFNYFDRIPKEEFQECLKQIEIRPWNIHIELSNICNASCIFCAYHFQNRKKMVMDKAIYSKALESYCLIGGGELRLESCVGDPLLDPNFIERVKEARAHPQIKEIITLTNGINLDKIGIKNLIYSGISRVNISTGPWDEKLYSSIYRSRDYQRLRNNITELLKANADAGEPVKIRLLFRSNLSMKKTMGLADYQAIRNLPHGVEFNTDFDTWRGRINKNDLLDGMHIRPIAGHDKEPCYWLYDGPIVFVDGKVGMCGCRDFNADSELIIGDITKTSLSDLWQSEKARDLRERFVEGKSPSICLECRSYANLDYYRTSRGLLRARLIREWLSGEKKSWRLN